MRGPSLELESAALSPKAPIKFQETEQCPGENQEKLPFETTDTVMIVAATITNKIVCLKKFPSEKVFVKG